MLIARARANAHAGPRSASPSPSSTSRSARRAERRAHRGDDRRGARRCTAPTSCCSRNSRSAAIRRKTCCCGRASSPTARPRSQRIAAAAHGIVAVVGWPQAAGSVVYNAASVLRDGARRAHLSQARAAQLRGVRRAPLLRRRSRSATPACSRSTACRSGWSSAKTCGSPSRWPAPSPAGARAGAGAERLAVRARQARRSATR